MRPRPQTQKDIPANGRLTRSTSIQGGHSSVSFPNKPSLRGFVGSNVPAPSATIKKSRRPCSLPPKSSNTVSNNDPSIGSSLIRNNNTQKHSFPNTKNAATKCKSTDTISPTRGVTSEPVQNQLLIQPHTRKTPNSAQLPSIVPKDPVQTNKNVSISKIRTAPQSILPSTTGAVQNSQKFLYKSSSTGQKIPSAEITSSTPVRPSVRRIVQHKYNKNPIQKSRFHNSSVASLSVRNRRFSTPEIPTSRQHSNQEENFTCENEPSVQPPNSVPSHNPSSSDIPCSSCTNKDEELSSMIKTFGELKEKYNREKALVNQLMMGHNQSVKTISDLETRNAALSARLDALQKTRCSSSKTSVTDIVEIDIIDQPICRLKISELMVDTRNIPDSYIPLLLEVRKQVRRVTFDEMTESKIDRERINGPGRGRDWEGRIEYIKDIPDDKEVGSPQLSFGQDIAIPMCPISSAETGCFFNSSGDYPQCLVQKALHDVVFSRERFSKYRDDMQWKTAVGVVLADKVTSTLFSKTLEAKLSNHKRMCKNTFFKMLGYDSFTVGPSSSRDQELREREKQELWEKLVQGVVNEEDPSSTIDCSTWRNKTWYDLHNNSNVNTKEPDFSNSSSGSTDILFKNNAAKIAYVSLTGYSPTQEDSIITLARADAWYTTCAWFLKISDGKGGKRNSQYTTMFSELLPRCVEDVLHTIQSIVARMSPTEFVLRDSDEYLPSMEYTNKTQYALALYDREMTNVVFFPPKSCYYIYLKPSMFKDHICHWLLFLDTYIGELVDNSSVFTLITRNVHLVTSTNNYRNESKDNDIDNPTGSENINLNEIHHTQSGAGGEMNVNGGTNVSPFNDFFETPETYVRQSEHEDHCDDVVREEDEDNNDICEDD